MTDTFATIDDYIGSFPAQVQIILHEVRRTILDAVPGAEETISYHIPTITLGGRNVVHFAAWKNHIVLYPTPTGSQAFEREIAPYRAARSTVRFSLRKPIPYGLIEQMVALLVARGTGAVS